MNAEKLYDDIIMDHIKNARNYRELPDANLRAQAVSQLCGDSVTVYVDARGDRIDDVGFQCVSCGISMASASMMTQSVKGKPLAEAMEIIATCLRLIDQQASMDDTKLGPEQLNMIQVLQAFPARKTCATVAWQALAAALRGDTDSVSV